MHKLFIISNIDCSYIICQCFSESSSTSQSLYLTETVIPGDCFFECEEIFRQIGQIHFQDFEFLRVAILLCLTTVQSDGEGNL